MSDPSPSETRLRTFLDQFRLYLATVTDPVAAKLAYEIIGYVLTFAAKSGGTINPFNGAETAAEITQKTAARLASLSSHFKS